MRLSPPCASATSGSILPAPHVTTASVRQLPECELEGESEVLVENQAQSYFPLF
jgi:hypothetical protein